MTNIVYTAEYNPAFESDRLASMKPHARHEEMLESHRQAKAQRRELHKRGAHKHRNVMASLR